MICCCEAEGGGGGMWWIRRVEGGQGVRGGIVCGCA